MPNTEACLDAVENTLQDLGYRIEQLEQNENLSDRITEAEKDIIRILNLLQTLTSTTETLLHNQELMAAKLP